MTKIRKHRNGIVFYRLYKKADRIVLILFPFVACLWAYSRSGSYILALVTLFLVLVTMLHFFRPAYGYLNISEKVAMNGRFEREQFSKVKIITEGNEMSVVNLVDNKALFTVPDLSLDQIRDLENSLKEYFVID